MLIHCYGFSLERVEVKTKARNKHLDVRQRAAVFNRQSIIVSCSTAPPESGTDSALADSVMQINSKDNTVCSNLFSSARRALRANVCVVCGCTSEGIGPTASTSSPSVGWNILTRSRSICESSATISKKKRTKKRGPKIGRKRTAFWISYYANRSAPSIYSNGLGMEEEKMRPVPQMNSKHTETHPFSTDVVKQTLLLPSSMGYRYI